MRRAAWICLLLMCCALCSANGQSEAGTSAFVKRYAAHYNVPPELIAAFILSGEQQLAELLSAAAKKDRNALARAAHKLKGACANIHAHALKSLAERLETHSADADVPALDQHNALLRREFERVSQFLTDPAVVPQPTKAAS